MAGDGTGFQLLITHPLTLAPAIDIRHFLCYAFIMSSYDLITPKTIRRRYAIVTFLVWFATALPLAVSVLLVQSRGLSLTEIGVVMGGYSLVIVLLEVPTGGLADAAGRKRVALVAHGLAALSNLALLFAFSLAGFMVAMALYGVSRALSSGALDAWFVDALLAADPDYDLQPALAEVETVSLLALGMGTLAGGALPRLFAGLPADGTAVLSPMAVPIAAAFVVRLLLLPVIAGLIRENRPSGVGPDRRGSSIRAVPALVRDAVALSRANGRLALLMAASFVSGFALLSIESFWQPFFAALPAAGSTPTILLGFIMAGSFLAGMGGNLLVGPVGRRLRPQHSAGDGRAYALVAGLARLAQGLSMLFLSATAALFPAAGFFWLVYLTSGVGLSPHAALVNAEIPAERRSTLLSIQSLAFYAGSFAGGAVLGRVADQWGIPAAWAIGGALLLASSLPYALLNHDRFRSKKISAADSTEMTDLSIRSISSGS